MKRIVFWDRPRGWLRWLRPANWTIRVRLTVLYGGLFFLAGAVLLALTYFLVRQSLSARGAGLAFPGVAERLPFQLPLDPESIQRLVADLRAEQARYRAETLDTLLRRGSMALGLVGLVALGFGWLVAERVLRPLNQITATAGRIATSPGRGLHERIALTGPRDEITRLADTFDSMLERLDRSFDGQRRFVANASHELRTPLAINRALIELAITKPDATAEVRQLGESLLSINSRHERLIDGLLLLADSENAVAETSAVDLADVAAQVVSQTPVVSVTIRADLSPAPTVGDPVLLERLVHNLVENAVRYNQPGGSVWLRTAGGAYAELVVTNTGPVVQPYQVETIFQPFRRLSSERADPERGFGLGLSIVAAVARAHDGTVVATPREGGGLTVTVRLPPSARS